MSRVALLMSLVVVVAVSSSAVADPSDEPRSFVVVRASPVAKEKRAGCRLSGKVMVRGGGALRDGVYVQASASTLTALGVLSVSDTAFQPIRLDEHGAFGVALEERLPILVSAWLPGQELSSVVIGSCGQDVTFVFDAH
jgi:hypothetical protein